MTNLILSTLLILCLAWPSHALSPAISQGTQAESGAPACATVVDYSTGDNNNTVVGYSASDFFKAFSFTAPADGGGTIKSVSFLVSKSGTPGSDLSAKICTDNSAKPSTTCVAATNTLTAASMSGSLSTKKFSFAGYSYAQSTRYWVVFSATVVDTSNFYLVRYNNAGAQIVTGSAESPISWSNVDSTSLGQMLVSQCE